MARNCSASKRQRISRIEQRHALSGAFTRQCETKLSIVSCAYVSRGP
jgi:hypothetical protein